MRSALAAPALVTFEVANILRRHEHASYVAVAELLDAPLVTLDRRRAEAPRLRCQVQVLSGS